MTYTEKELTDQFKDPENREKVFRIIISKYQERLYWHVRKIVIRHEDADDVLQNTFLKAWQNADNFRQESRLYTWLYRIATNESLNLLRKEQKEYRTSLEDVQAKLATGLENDEYFEGDELQKKLQQVILSLPERQRLVFNMKYFEEMKYEDMAEILNLSVGALKASYHHAVKKIRNYFSEH